MVNWHVHFPICMSLFQGNGVMSGGELACPLSHFVVCMSLFQGNGVTSGELACSLSQLATSAGLRIQVSFRI